VLVIEDDDSLREILSHNLRREGYDVVGEADGQTGYERALRDLPDLIVLDLMLPRMSGVEICRELRAARATKHVPVIMLTAKNDEADQIAGFSVGADDYVTKPFSVKVLLERVRVALARRPPVDDAGSMIEMHGLTLDAVAHDVRRDGASIPLTPTEYRLLETLMTNAGRAFSRAELLDSAVGEDIVVLERTIDVHVRSLRAKLGDLDRVIETVRGVGYRFARPTEEV
jgi:two-component system phosphate regulon response regulator PhoB